MDKYVFRPGCSVYMRPDGTWIFPQNVQGAGGASITVGPAEKVEAGSDAVGIGEAVIAALARSRLEDHDPKQPWPHFRAPRSAGFKSYNELERDAALLSVRRCVDGMKVSAWNAAKRGGFEPAPDGERTCEDKAAAIGALILELSGICGRREGKGTRGKSGGGVETSGASGAYD